MIVYIDYYLDHSQKPENSKGVCLDKKYNEQLKEALDFISYCGPKIAVLFTKQLQRYRICLKGDRDELVRLLEETDLPFNLDNIIVPNSQE